MENISMLAVDGPQELLASVRSYGSTESAWMLVRGSIVYIIVHFLIKRTWETYQFRKARYRKLVNLPVVNLEGNKYADAEQKYIAKMEDYLRIGREKYGEKGYQLWGPEGYLVILPDAAVEDLKSEDDSFADNRALAQGFIGDYLWIDLVRPEIPHNIVHKLTPRMGSIMPQIHEEVQHCIDTEFPQSTDWTSVCIHEALARTVCMVSGRAFVGLPISREEKWIETSINYATDLVKAGNKSRDYSYLYKAIATRLNLIPDIARMYEYERYAVSRLVPVLKKRSREQASDPKARKPEDMLQYMMEHAKEATGQSFEEQARVQLVLIMSAIHASTLAATNMVYDLVAHPEYFQALRDEVDEVWNASGGSLDKQSMAKLVKLDSFLKESQRLSPAAHVTFNRKVTNKKGFTLSSGLHLPHGTIYAVAASQISKDGRAWDEPETFKGFRFADLRAASKDNANKYQFVTTNSSHSMAFGHGKHACPGRFFAGNEIKTLVATLIRKFDVRPAPGYEKRPESLEFGINLNTDPNHHIMLKRREGNY